MTKDTTQPMEELDEIFRKSGWKYSKPKNNFRGWWKKSRPSFMQNQMTEAEMRNLKQALAKLISIQETKARIEEIELLGDELDNDHSEYHRPGEDGEVYDMNKWYEHRLNQLNPNPDRKNV